MFKVLSLLGLGVAGGAALSPETKAKLKAAARGVRDDFATATKDARGRTSREWGRFTKWFREDVLEEPPRRAPPASPPPS